MKYKNMDGWSKFLFIVGWVGVIGSIISALMGIFITMNPTAFTDQFAEDVVSASGITLIITGVVGAVVSWLDIRAAKDNSKVMLPLILTIADLVLYVVSVVMGSVSTSTVIGIVITVVEVIACFQIKKKNA